ncbi:DUF2713 family protein [Escherichia coli]
MKRLADGGEMNFDGYLDKMSHLVNEGTLFLIFKQNARCCTTIN